MKNGIGKQVNKVIKLLGAHVEWLSVDEEKEADAKAIYDDAYEAVLLAFSEMQSRLESLEKDAELLDWLGTAPVGCIRMDTNPCAPTYINYSASGGDIRPALTKAMQANKGE